MSKKFNFDKNLDASWLSSEISDKILAGERQSVMKILPDMHGLFLLQLSALNQKVIQSTTLKHGFFVGSSTETDAIIDFDRLPFRPNSIDCTVLHHVLDYSNNPHQCLREAACVTVPNGFMVLVGFNPISIWGLLRVLRLTKTPAPASFITSMRLVDWLAFLGFRVESVSSSQFLPPIFIKYFPKFSSFIEAITGKIGISLGMSHIVVARKLVAGRTPIRPQWGRIASKGSSVVAPAARGVPSSR